MTGLVKYQLLTSLDPNLNTNTRKYTRIPVYIQNKVVKVPYPVTTGGIKSIVARNRMKKNSSISN